MPLYDQDNDPGDEDTYSRNVAPRPRVSNMGDFYEIIRANYMAEEMIAYQSWADALMQ